MKNMTLPLNNFAKRRVPLVHNIESVEQLTTSKV